MRQHADDCYCNTCTGASDPPIPSPAIKWAPPGRDQIEHSIQWELATSALVGLLNLRRGKWPPGKEQAYWIVWAKDNGTDIQTIATVLGVTRERVKQIYNQTLREAKERDTECSGL